MIKKAIKNKIVKIKSFNLAIRTKGKSNSSKLAILIPGRLDTKDYVNFVSHLKLFANLGFFTVAFDPPGTWYSPGKTDLLTTTNYIKAINELIEFFGNKPTILLGHSRGGSAAILASLTNKNIVGIILVMANYGAPTSPTKKKVKVGFKLTYRDLPPGNIETKIKKEFKLPFSYWADGKKHNIIKSLQACLKPKLLIYGTADEFTKPKDIVKINKNIPKPKMLIKIDSVHD